MPSGEDLIISVIFDEQKYQLYVCKSAEDEEGNAKPGTNIFSSLISFASGDEFIKNNSNALETNDPLVDRMFNELLFSVQPNFVPINECMSLENFYKFLNTLKEKNLIDIMTALNNGAIGTSNAPILVKFKQKENVVLMLEISAKPYSSNCVAEYNFLTKESGIAPNSLFYYFLTVSVWDDAKKSALDLATAVLVFPLDAGYGDPHLPSELNSICKSDDLSGTEILGFVKQILAVIQPKKIYLNDASSIELKNKAEDPEKKYLYLRIIRPLIGGQTFYAEYAQFEVCTCKKFKSHLDVSINQSKEKYMQSLKYLRNYTLGELKIILTEKAQEQIKNILKDYNEETTLSECLSALFKLYRSGISNDVLDLYFVLIDDRSLIPKKNSRKFSDHIQVLWDTCVFESTAYEKR